MEENRRFSRKNVLNMIRSKYILGQIMNNLLNNKLLDIIRYNKNIKNKIDKDIRDYKSEYFKIEIELITTGHFYRYNKFINFQKKMNHIIIFFFFFIKQKKKQIKLIMILT